MDDRRVLLTGATGFIGRHAVADLARRGFDVHAVSSRARRPAAGVGWHAADLLQPGAPSRLCAQLRPTHLLHLAWYAEHGRFWTSPLNLDWVRASIELMTAFRQSGGVRLVAAGTCAEYDWSEGTCSETRTPAKPHTLYGQSKNALRLLAETYAGQTGLSSAWGRIFHVYGPHEHPDRLVAAVVRGLLSGQRVACTSGLQLRDFMYVDDAAAAFVALLDSDLQGAVNIASGQAVSLREVVERIARITGHGDLVEFGARPAPPGDPPVLLADVTRLKSELHWTPSISLDAGLRETVAWWRANLQEATSDGA